MGDQQRRLDRGYGRVGKGGKLARKIGEQFGRVRGLRNDVTDFAYVNTRWAKGSHQRLRLVDFLLRNQQVLPRLAAVRRPVLAPESGGSGGAAGESCLGEILKNQNGTFSRSRPAGLVAPLAGPFSPVPSAYSAANRYDTACRVPLGRPAVSACPFRTGATTCA